MRQVKARDLYGRMMRTLAQTGNGWMTFKDAANRLCNQTGAPGNVVHLSNLCTEILEVTSDGETAVCNLGSINLGAHVAGDGVDWDEAARRPCAPRSTFLDRVIDINYYPTAQAAASNPRWRPVGLGVMGLQDVFFALRLPFDSAAARELSTRIAEEIYLTALETSADLAETLGPHPAYAADPRRRRASCSPTSGASTPDADRAVGGAAASGSPSTACATRCWSRSRRPPPSPRSPAATSASSRRCPTCSSARPCPASSCRSTPHLVAS